MRYALLVPAIFISVSSTAFAQAQPASMSDTDFVNAAAMSDMYEIQAGQMAQSQGQSSRVKSFGQEMVQAHTQTSNTLKSTVSTAGIAASPPSSLDSRHQAMLDSLKTAGSGFDRMYLSQQRDAHQEALTLMQNYASNGGNPALKQVASRTTPVIQQHIAMLESMR